MNNLHTIESIWYSRSQLLRIILWPLNLFFLFLVKLKRLLYTCNILSSHRFSKPVIVIGNITIGGTGKTPFINQLVRVLAQDGIKAGIVSRGYQAAIKNHPHQVDRSSTAIDVGDEAYMQYVDLNQKSRLSIPMIIDPDRSQAINYLIEKNDVDIVISDDGLQHYQMQRDIEILLVDGERQFGNRLILPFGPLREPVSRTKTVDLVIQNGETKSPFSDFNVYLKPCKLVQLMTGKEVSLEEFSNEKVIAIAGIGNPDRFFNSLKNICTVENKKAFPDHYDFKYKDFVEFQNDTIVMTEKDASKCFTFADENWYYLKVEMNFEHALSERLLSMIKNVIKHK